MWTKTLLKLVSSPLDYHQLNRTKFLSHSWGMQCLSFDIIPVVALHRTQPFSSVSGSLDVKRSDSRKRKRPPRCARNRKTRSSADSNTVKESFDSTPPIPIIAVTSYPVFPIELLNKKMVITEGLLAGVLNEYWRQNQPYAGAFLRKDGRRSEVVNNLDDIYRVGTLVEIVDPLDEKGSIVIKGRRRIRLVSAPSHVLQDSRKHGEPILFAHVEDVLDEQALGSQTEAISVNVLRDIKNLVPRKFPSCMNPTLHVAQRYAKDFPKLADFGAMLTDGEPAQLQAVMEEIDVSSRMLLTSALLQRDLICLGQREKVRKSVDEKVKLNKHNNLQMEMTKTRNLLGADDEDAHVEKFRSRLKSLVIPKKVNESIDEQLSNLSSLHYSSPEYDVTRNYVDWLTSMPWGHSTKENLDIDEAKCILDEDHYGLDDVKERILEFIAVRTLSERTRGKMLCLTGAPGVGKTSVGKSIARTLNRNFFRFNVGAMTDVSEVKGHRRTYIGAMPGKIVQCFKRTKCENPLILLDEIDKIGSSGYAGDPASALLEVLDPEQNSEFLDHFLNVPLDLSKVLFVCTANTITTIPSVLRDRLEVIHVSGYTDEEKICIAEKFLIPVLVKESGATNEQCVIDDTALRMLVRDYCRESGIRNLKKHIQKIVRKSVLMNAKGQHSVVVTEENLHKFVGKPVFSPETIYENSTPPGVCTGLAWNTSGGTLLFIETLLKPSSGEKEGSLETSGQLGDVLDESIQVAYSYAKSFFLQLYPENDFFTNSPIHLHIPSGSIPKDGTSVGCAAVSALLSLALGRSIKKKLTMAGEVSATGKILPVQGIKEKLLAAHRSNIHTVFLPEANRMEYNALPDYLKLDFNVVFADKYDNIYKEAFI